MNAANVALLHHWNSLAAGASPSKASRYEIHIANALFTRRDKPLKPGFVHCITRDYAAECGDLAGAPDNINRWVRAKTNGKISQIVQPEDINDDLDAILVDAVYLNAPWQTAFDPQATREQPFMRTDGRPQPCQMMHPSHADGPYTYSYFQGSHFQAIRLPYAEGSLKMRLFLPDRQTPLSAFLMQVTAENWKQWETRYHPAEGDFAMPRFEVASKRRR